MSHFSFTIEHKDPRGLARVGEIHTPNGVIKTPAYVVVGTTATVKMVTPEMLQDIGVEVVLANTYHLYLQPGDKTVKQGGGFGKFMNWHGPTMTDSGGFQVFSLGEAYGTKVSKVASGDETIVTERKNYDSTKKLCTIDEEGVDFKSYRDGSKHRITPERSMEIQWNLGADIIFAFDECTSPLAPYEYQLAAWQRTERWAKRCITRHEELDPENKQAIFGVVQGGRFEDLRRLSAKTLSSLNFDGFGIGGSFNKEDLGTAVRWVNEELPEDKPRHLLGIGEPVDLFLAVENGCDLFDCVIPTRLARHGNVYTVDGPLNLKNSKYKNDFSPLDYETPSYTSRNYTRAYLSHLYRSGESLGATLGSVHNLYFLVSLVKQMRQALLDGNFHEFKETWLTRYYKK